jgi:hypothetical protein
VDYVHNPVGDGPAELRQVAELIGRVRRLGIIVELQCDRCETPMVLIPGGFRHADGADALICSILYPV